MVSSIQVFGDKQAARVLEGIGSRAANARPAMEEIYLTILDIEEETFEKEGARGGFMRWQPDAYATIQWKARHWHHPAILRASNRLHSAMTTYRSADTIVRITGTELMVQPNIQRIPYGRIQQKGGRTKVTTGKGPGGKIAVGRGPRGGVKYARGYVDIPARPYLRFTESDADAFSKEIMRHLTRPIGRGKLGVQFSG